MGMDPKYLLGIPEIDAQHQEICQFVDSLRDVIAQKDKWHVLHQAFKRLHLTLGNHFDLEESFMAMVNYDALSKHKKEHKSILKFFEDYFDHPPATSDIEYFGNFVADKVLGHVMEHDLVMTAILKQHLGIQ